MQSSTSSPSSATAMPAIYMIPLNESFQHKQIPLDSNGGRVKIGRQTNVKTCPSETNGWFDSKVLSRMHAEIWYEDQRVFIKDVKSSNGTFINGSRLSPEATESGVHELHSGDMVEFGIDIINEETKMVMHQKVSAKIYCIVDSESLKSYQRDFLYHQNQLLVIESLRRQSASKSGMQLDRILAKLQAELHKSKETGSELNALSSSISEIQETLGGSLPASMIPVNPTSIPPFRSAGSSQAVDSLHTALTDAQTNLQLHAQKISSFEKIVQEQDRLKLELSTLREELLRRHSKRSSHGASSKLHHSSSKGARVSSKERSSNKEKDASFGNGTTSKLASLDSDQSSETETIIQDMENYGEDKIFSYDEAQIKEQTSELAIRIDSLSYTLQHNQDQIKSASESFELIQHKQLQTDETLSILQSQLAELAITSPSEAVVKVNRQSDPGWMEWRTQFEKEREAERAEWKIEKESLSSQIRKFEDFIEEMKKDGSAFYSSDSGSSSPSSNGNSSRKRRSKRISSTPAKVNDTKVKIEPGASPSPQSRGSSRRTTITSSSPMKREDSMLQTKQESFSQGDNMHTIRESSLKPTSAAGNEGRSKMTEHNDSTSKTDVTYNPIYVDNTLPIFSAAGAVFLGVAVWCIYQKFKE